MGKTVVRHTKDVWEISLHILIQIFILRVLECSCIIVIITTKKIDFLSKKLAKSNFLDENKLLSSALVESIRRPDYCLGPHLRQMLLYGCTRLEIGVQSTYEDVARDTNRGHTVAAVADCFCLAKDAGFKVCYKWSYVQTQYFQQLKFSSLTYFRKMLFSFLIQCEKCLSFFFI